MNHNTASTLRMQSAGRCLDDFDFRLPLSHPTTVSPSGVGGLHINDFLLSTGAQHNCDGGLASVERLQNVFLHPLVIIRWFTDFHESWQEQILLGSTFLCEQRALPIASICIKNLVFCPLHEGCTHIVRCWAEILILLSSEDVCRNYVCLGMPMLASLGGGHLNTLAGVTFDHEVGALADFTGLHRVCV